MAKVAPPIRLTVVRKVALRPTRSPIAPKMIAPSGRKAKPTANSASAAISAEVGSSPARNTLAMTGVSEPKMKKSYHSNAVPAEEAVTTRAIDQGLAGSDMKSPPQLDFLFGNPSGCCGTRNGLARAGQHPPRLKEVGTIDHLPIDRQHAGVGLGLERLDD